MNAAVEEPVTQGQDLSFLVVRQNTVEIKRSQHVFHPNLDRRESLMMQPVSETGDRVEGQTG